VKGACPASGRSVVVPVTVMFRVPVPVMDVVGVVVMGDSDMAAASGVHVLMVPMNFVRTGHAFVDVVTVRAVYVGVVRVVDMILVRECHVPAIRAVNVRMAGMRLVLGTCCHRVLLSRWCDLPGRPAWQPNARKTAARSIAGSPHHARSRSGSVTGALREREGERFRGAGAGRTANTPSCVRGLTQASWRRATTWPSLATLSQDYGVALTTARKALAAPKGRGPGVTSPMSTFVCKDA
jgi:hypothetical protein